MFLINGTIKKRRKTYIYIFLFFLTKMLMVIKYNLKMFISSFVCFKFLFFSSSLFVRNEWLIFV